VLSILGLSQEGKFHKYHRVLSHAHWSALAGSGILLRQLLNCFIPSGPVVLGIDETLERSGPAFRWGKQIRKEVFIGIHNAVVVLILLKQVVYVGLA
jgi:hypothetical protein